MKKSKIILVLVLMLIMITSTSLAIMPKDWSFTEVPISLKIVSRGVAILLSCMQILQYVAPVLYFVIATIINKKKQKITLKNIYLNLLISIAIFVIFFVVGNLILNNTSYYGYSSRTVDYIRYNGDIIYFHR